MVPSSPADGEAIAASKFYGKSLPRPTIIGDQQLPASELAKAQRDRVGFVPATQPLLEWSKKAPARHGGTRPQWVGKPPTWVMTPYRAFVLDKIRLLLRSDPDAKLLPFKEQMALALEKSAIKWTSLNPEQTELCESMARDDAVRYERELAEYERRNPGYCAWAAARRKGRKAWAASWPGAPAPAPTARQLFVRSRIAEAEHDDPELADAEPKARRTALRKVTLAAVQAWKKLDDDTKASFDATAEEAAGKHEDELQAYEAEHPGYRDWLAEAATAKAAAAKAARTGKRRSKSRPGKDGKAGRKASKTSGAKVSSDDERGSGDDSDMEDEDFLGSDWELALSSSDDDDDGPGRGGDEGDAEDAELEGLRREAAGESPQQRGSSRRKRVLAPMSPPKSSKRSRSAAPAACTAPEPADAEADEEAAIAAPPKKKTPAKKGHGSTDAPPADPTSVVGLAVSKQFFAPGSKGKKKRPVQRFSGVVVEHNIFDGVDNWQIKYEDSDCEDVEWPELRKLLADGAAQPSKSAQKRGGSRKSK